MNRIFLNMIISPKSSKLQIQRDRSRQYQDTFTEKLISCLYPCDSVNYSSSGLEGTQRTLFFPIPFQLCHAAKRHRTAIIFELSGTHRTQPATYEKKQNRGRPLFSGVSSRNVLFLNMFAALHNYLATLPRLNLFPNFSRNISLLFELPIFVHNVKYLTLPMFSKFRQTICRF